MSCASRSGSPEAWPGGGGPSVVMAVGRIDRRGAIGRVSVVGAGAVPVSDSRAARIAAMCRSVERGVLLSQAFAEAMNRLERGRLVSVGRYALRGVEHPQELFTLDPFASL